MTPRPLYLTQPWFRWSQTPRTDQSAVDYACPLERKRPQRTWHPAEWVMLGLFIFFLLGVGEKWM